MIGLSDDDRLICRAGKSEFKTARGVVVELNDVRSCTKPHALISHDIAGILAELLHTHLQCDIEVVRWTDGFEFIFHKAPVQHLIEVPVMYHITVRMLDDYDRRLHPDETKPKSLSDITNHLNQDGAEMIHWILLRLHLLPLMPKEKDFVLSYNRMEVSWTPPQQQEGYAPLRGNHTDDQPACPTTQKSAAATSAVISRRKR